MSAIVGPIAPYSNVPIEPQFYQPSRFQISDIVIGNTTLVTTTEDHNYVVGQLVRLIVPKPYGTYQLNEMQGYVISIPTSTSVEIDIVSKFFNTFVQSPFQYTITNASNASKCVLTVTSSYIGSGSLKISDVSGMTELNGNIYTVYAANTTSITLNVDSSFFTPYTGGGIATIYPTDSRVSQIMAIGDINSGQINSNGLNMEVTYIPGSYINISPQ